MRERLVRPGCFVQCFNDRRIGHLVGQWAQVHGAPLSYGPWFFGCQLVISTHYSAEGGAWRGVWPGHVVLLR